MGRLHVSALSNNAALYQRIATGASDAMESLERVLVMHGEPAWKVKLKSSVYTVVNAITGCRDARLRHRLLDRLEASYPAGHQLWKDTVMLSVEADWDLVQRYRKNNPDAKNASGLLRQTVLYSNAAVARQGWSEEAFDVFSRLAQERPENLRALEVADAWQYAVLGMNVDFMERILDAHPVDVNQPMLGDASPGGQASLSNPNGMDVVEAICQFWKSYGIDDERFHQAFLLLERHGLNWETPTDRWEKVPLGYREKVVEWHHEARQERLTQVLPDVTMSKGRGGPRL